MERCLRWALLPLGRLPCETLNFQVKCNRGWCCGVCFFFNTKLDFLGLKPKGDIRVCAHCQNTWGSCAGQDLGMGLLVS